MAKTQSYKERLYGVGGPEGNHGEDVKEFYFYEDSTPAHTYMKALYKYPQQLFPYEQLSLENRNRGQDRPEYELADTGVFDNSEYFDVRAEYAKESPNNILVRITISKRGPKAAPIHILPTLWFRNTWTWGCQHEGCGPKPTMSVDKNGHVAANHETLGSFLFAADKSTCGAQPEWLFTDNDSQPKYMPDASLVSKYSKDTFHEYVVNKKKRAVNTARVRTKVAARYATRINAGEEVVLRIRLWAVDEPAAQIFGDSFNFSMGQRIAEADAFYAQKIHATLAEAARQTMRQAYGGLMWTKQFYNYSVYDWLKGDANMPAPPAH